MKSRLFWLFSEALGHDCHAPLGVQVLPASTLFSYRKDLESARDLEQDLNPAGPSSPWQVLHFCTVEAAKQVFSSYTWLEAPK